MGSLSDPGDSGGGDGGDGGGEFTHSDSPTSFDDFQRQTSLMTSCTLLWKELSDHFTSLEQDLLKKSEAIQNKIKSLDTQTNASLQSLTNRETTIESSVSIAMKKVEKCLQAVKNDEEVPEVDDSEGLSLRMKSFCAKVDSSGFWRFIIDRKKEMEVMREKIPVALGECVDPAKFVLEAISEVFPVDKRGENGNDLGWACVLMLESLIPVVVDPILGNCRMLVTPSVKRNAKEIAGTWKESLDQRGGIENVKTPDVHTFLQHLVTFGIVKNEDFDFYKKLVVGSAWRKQMPRLAVSLGLSDKMPDMIEELISKGQQVDAVHFTHEAGLVDRFPPAPLLKAFLKDAKKVATSILEDPNNSGRAALLAARKEQSALKAVIKCIEEYKLESEFPPDNLKKRLEQLEKVKIEKKRPAATVPANKRTRVSNVGPMPPAKAGRITNAYVSSFPAVSAPAFVRSPSHNHYPSIVPGYLVPPPQMYGHGNRSPSTNSYAAYSPESASLSPPLSYQGTPPINYPVYGVYGNGMAPTYQQVYYR